jgi:hypothetical protein
MSARCGPHLSHSSGGRDAARRGEVSRESLQAAMEDDWSLTRYDILPDRVILNM